MASLNYLCLLHLLEQYALTLNLSLCEVYIIFHDQLPDFILLYQDINMKVISFSQQGPRAICILSANGMISNVTLRQHDSLGGTVTYEVCSLFSLLR
jgi:hypothetical protein